LFAPKHIDWYVVSGNLKLLRILLISTLIQLYDITTYRIEQLSRQYKDYSLKFDATTHRSYSDRVVHHFSFNETATVFAKNVGYVDSNMTRAAMTPLSNIQQNVIVWIEDYGNSFGDFSPNSNDVALSASTKEEIYEDYKCSMSSFNEPYISLKVFLDLWNTLFPHYKLRKWCSIPHKCEICSDLDTIRRSSNIIAVREAAKQAHVLHRGGLFMLERQELVNIHLTLFIYYLTLT